MSILLKIILRLTRLGKRFDSWEVVIISFSCSAVVTIGEELITVTATHNRTKSQ